jgi:hypothetical protein
VIEKQQTGFAIKKEQNIQAGTAYKTFSLTVLNQSSCLMTSIKKSLFGGNLGGILVKHWLVVLDNCTLNPGRDEEWFFSEILIFIVG